MAVSTATFVLGAATLRFGSRLVHRECLGTLLDVLLMWATHIQSSRCWDDQAARGALHVRVGMMCIVMHMVWRNGSLHSCIHILLIFIQILRIPARTVLLRILILGRRIIRPRGAHIGRSAHILSIVVIVSRTMHRVLLFKTDHMGWNWVIARGILLITLGRWPIVCRWTVVTSRTILLVIASVGLGIIVLAMLLDVIIAVIVLLELLLVLSWHVGRLVNPVTAGTD